MTDFSSPNQSQFEGFDVSSEAGRCEDLKSEQKAEIQSDRLNPEVFYKRHETAQTPKTQMQKSVSDVSQFSRFSQPENAKTRPQSANPDYYMELATAINNNPELRQRFLDIVAPSPRQSAQNNVSAKNNVPAQSQTQEVLTEPILDRESGTQRGITCALDFSLADVEARMPNYFSGTPARSMLRDYLRENCPNLPTDELYKVLNLAIVLENQAIEHYKNGLRHQKNLNDGNAAAISKLATNSAQGKGSGLEFNKIFTRADIRSMPIEDFRKNEKEIFAQYRAGLIK